MSKKLQIALALCSMVLMGVSAYQEFTGHGNSTETGQSALLLLILSKMDK